MVAAYQFWLNIAGTFWRSFVRPDYSASAGDVLLDENNETLLDEDGSVLYGEA